MWHALGFGRPEPAQVAQARLLVLGPDARVEAKGRGDREPRREIHSARMNACGHVVAGLGRMRCNLPERAATHVQDAGAERRADPLVQVERAQSTPSSSIR